MPGKRFRLRHRGDLEGAPGDQAEGGLHVMNKDRDLLVWATDGSPTRELLSRYWQPVALVNELSVGNTAKGLRLFGSHFVAARDRRGDCSLVSADIAVSGSFHGKYPCQDRNGIVFAYLGEGDIPSLPDFDCYTAPEDHTFVRAGYTPRSWREALEAELSQRSTARTERQAKTRVVETNYGLRIIAGRDLGDGNQGLRVCNLMFPNALVAPAGADIAIVVWFVPVDDQHHRWFALWYSFENRIDKTRLPEEILNFAPISDSTKTMTEVTRMFRLLLLDGMTDVLSGRAPLLTVDGVSRFLFRGPVAIDTAANTHGGPPAWAEADLARRSRSPWAGFIEENWRWADATNGPYSNP